MNETTVTTPNELEIRVERIFDARRAHVFSVWTDPKLIPGWWGDGTVVEEMDVRPGGTYRFRTAFGVVEGEFRDAALVSDRDEPLACRRRTRVGARVGPVEDALPVYVAHDLHAPARLLGAYWASFERALPSPPP